MIPSRVLRAREAYQPMIKFLGQRSKIEYGAHAPAPHPAAPKDIVENFQTFLAKLQSSSAGPSNPSSTPKGQSTKQSEKGATGGQEAENDREMLKGPIASSRGGGGGRGAGAGGGSAGGGGGGKASGSGGKPVDFENFWEAPEFMWRHPEVTEREIEAVMSGGATDIRSGP